MDRPEEPSHLWLRYSCDVYVQTRALNLAVMPMLITSLIGCGLRPKVVQGTSDEHHQSDDESPISESQDTSRIGNSFLAFVVDLGLIRWGQSVSVLRTVA